MHYPVYTQDYPGEHPTPPYVPPTTPRRGLMLKALLGVLASLIVAVVVSSNAHAQDMSAQLEEYNAVCFDEQGEWLKTDGCIESAESLGIEIDNLLESEGKGCTLTDMYEDYSCKGPSAPSSSSVSEQEEVSEQSYRPLTQEGTYAPADWQAHVVSLKPAAAYKPAGPTSKASSTARPTTSTPVKTVAYAPHDPRDTGRSQGQVVSESKRAEVHAKASKVESKLKAQEAAKKAKSKKK